MTAAPPVGRFGQFLITAAREVTDDDVALVGFHWPMVATRIARLTHAPNVTAVYESGVVETVLTPELPTSPADLRAAAGSAYCGSSTDALFAWLGRGRVTRTLLEAPIVDRRGNVNTTVVGPYDRPAVRMPGSGGGTELASMGRGLTLLTASQDPRSFPERVDYITSPGYLRAPGDRQRYGYPDDRGPRTLITPLGRFCIDDTDGVRVEAVHEGVTTRDLRACFRWLDAAPPKVLPVLPAPTAAEVNALAQVLDSARRSHYRLPPVT